MREGKRGNTHDERVDYIDMLLEELRLNTEDLHELAKQATVRARETVAATRLKLKPVRDVREKRRRR